MQKKEFEVNEIEKLEFESKKHIKNIAIIAVSTITANLAMIPIIALYHSSMNNTVSTLLAVLVGLADFTLIELAQAQLISFREKKDKIIELKKNNQKNS